MRVRGYETTELLEGVRGKYHVPASRERSASRALFQTQSLTIFSLVYNAALAASRYSTRWNADQLYLTDLCTRLGRDLSSLSQAANRLRKPADRNSPLAAELERTREDLAQIQMCQTGPQHRGLSHSFWGVGSQNAAPPVTSLSFSKNNGA